MIDHLGFPVSDYERSKRFYLAALAPLGYVLVKEVKQPEHDTPGRASVSTESRTSGSVAKAD